MSNQPSNQQVLQVRYDDVKASYANHVLVSVGAEEIYLDFTSGAISDRQGASVLPIHTRVAMTPSGVVRLAQLLQQTCQNFQVVNLNPPPQTPPVQVEQPPLEPI